MGGIASSLEAWLRLAHEPGLKPLALRELLRRAGSPRQVYAMSDVALAAVVGDTLARQMRAAPLPDVAKSIERALHWAAQPERHLLTWSDPAYPPLLLETPDPPPILYVAGEPACLSRPCVAVVGARNATPGGLDNARGMARQLAAHGWCVVSGLASGIDAAAHQGALEAGAAGGGTLAVFGTGADIIYPARNRALARRVAQGGAILSEFPLGAPALAHRFPRRNRLVAGLAQGVLVVEAALQSGSLITARLAGELGREVFAMPGSIHSPLSRGCHALIRQGAVLTESIDDILAELRPPQAMPVRASAAPLPPERGATPELFDADSALGQSTDRGQAARPATARADTQGDDGILHALGHDPIHLDDLQRRLQMDSAGLLARLLTLELAGKVVRLAGGRYQQRY